MNHPSKQNNALPSFRKFATLSLILDIAILSLPFGTISNWYDSKSGSKSFEISRKL
jgi:hypothetical protein